MGRGRGWRAGLRHPRAACRQCRALATIADTVYCRRQFQHREDLMVAISFRRYALAAGALTGFAATSEAQAPRALVGLVKDSLGHAVPGAEVRARGNIVVAFSDDSGRFHVAKMPVGARGVFVRRLGFAPARAPITPSAGD